VFATRRCIGRVARPVDHASATFCAGVPLPAGRFTWPGRAPFGVEAFLGFRPVIATDNEVGPNVTRVTVFASTPFPTALVGFQMIPSQVCSRGRVRPSVSAPSDPRAVCRSLRRSGFAARSAGPVETWGVLFLSSHGSAPCKHGG
jgi:hypothetical protein